MSFLSSLSFLQLSALFALLALALPLLIHLFNTTRGQIVWVGNLALFRQAQKSRVTEIKITQWLLLFIRLLLITLLVFLMARLVSQVFPGESSEQRVYLSEYWLFNAEQKDIAELFANHSERPIFLLTATIKKNSGETQLLSKVDAENIYTYQKQLRNAFKSAPFIPVETLLAELESPESITAAAMAYSGNPLTSKPIELIPELTIVYTTNRLGEHPFMRPKLQQHYQWQVKALSEKLKQHPINVLLLFTQERYQDQQYLSLAFNYLAQSDERNIQFQSQLVPSQTISSQALSEDGDFNKTLSSFRDKPHPDWVIYLSDNEIPPALRRWIGNESWLLTDSASLPLQTHTTGTIMLARPHGTIEVYQYSALSLADDITPLWQDAFGNALLIQRGEKQLQWLSRFHPHATNWVMQKEFPQALAAILSRAQLNDAKALLGSQQIAQLNQTTKQALPENRYVVPIDRPLNNWLLFIIAILWLIERWLAERNNRPLAEVGHV